MVDEGFPQEQLAQRGYRFDSCPDYKGFPSLPNLRDDGSERRAFIRKISFKMDNYMCFCPLYDQLFVTNIKIIVK